MTMHEDVTRNPTILSAQVIRTEFQDGFDMLGCWHDLTLRCDDDVVKAQRRAVVLSVGLECFQFRVIRIQNRQNMRDIASTLCGQFLNTTNSQLRDNNQRQNSIFHDSRPMGIDRSRLRFKLAIIPRRRHGL